MFNFLKTAIFRGLVVLIPVVILYVTIRELLQLMVALATPIADLFPAGTFDHHKETEIIGSLLIVKKSQVEILPLTLDEFSLSLTHFGLGLADQIAEHSRVDIGKPGE